MTVAHHRFVGFRLALGRFLLDYIETFVGLVPVQLFLIATIPTSSMADAKAAIYAWTMQLLAPAAAALISAGRRALVNAWPSIKAYLESGFGATG